MSEFVTPNGKTIDYFTEPGTSLLRIKFTTGGELPSELSGLFTSVYEVEKTIKGYLGKAVESSKKAVKEK